MKQLRLEWQDADDAGKPNEVVLEAETKEAVIVLMARALLAVVQGVAQAEEVVNERLGEAHVRAFEPQGRRLLAPVVRGPGEEQCREPTAPICDGAPGPRVGLW